MASPTRLAVKNILWIPEIYPRYEVNQDRVAHFVDLMRSGKNLPPIKVSEYDGEDLIFDVDDSILNELKQDKYVLLDGKHRLEAHLQLGIEWIEVFFFNTPSASWDFASARFNAEGPLQLCRGEWKDLIIRAYLCRLHAGRPITTNDIAEEIGGAVTVQYIRRVLKPFRDADRHILEKQIHELDDQGLSQRQIARELGVGRKVVRTVLSRSERWAQKKQFPLGPACNNNNLQGKKTPKVNITSFPKSHPQQDTSQEQEQAQQQVAIGSGSGEDCVTATPEVDTTPKSSKPAEIIQFPSTNRNEETQEDATESATIPSDADKTPDQTDPINNNDYDPLDPEDNAALEMYCFLDIEHPKAYQALRALELVKQLKWDFLQISEFLGEPVEFLRQVLVFALAVVTSTGDPDPVKDMAFKLLDLPYDVIDCVRNALSAHAMLAPAGEEILGWIEENLSKSDIELAAQIASATGKEIIADDIQYIVAGKTPPRQRANYCTELTEEQRTTIKEEMHQTTVCFRKYRDLLNTGMFRGDALREVIKYYNRARTASNEVDEAILNCRKRGYL